MIGCVACHAHRDPATPRPAGERLERGQPRERALAADETHRYQVDVAASQVLLGTVEQRGIDVVVTTFDPAGHQLAVFDHPGWNRGAEAVVIEAARAGAYTIEVRPAVPPPDRRDAMIIEPGARYAIQIDEVLTQGDYVDRQLAATIESPRLRELAKALRAHQPQALETFWASLAGATPLVEPYAGDGATVLTTFVVRSPAPYVALVGGPASFQEHPMLRLADTDLWYLSAPMPRDARGSYWFVVADQPLAFHVPFRPMTLDDRKTLVDPNNPRSSADESRFELPGAPARAWSRHAPDVPAGRQTPVELASVALKEQRRIGIYTPPNYDPTASYPLVIAFDGEAYGLIPEYNELGIPLPWILDNLIAAKKIPPVVAVLVAEQGERMRDLAMSSAFADFITGELLPTLRAEYHAGLTPAATILTGSSLGGMCATFIALHHPAQFGNVLSQSGAFGFRPGLFDRELSIGDDDGSLIRALVESPRLPIQFYLDAGVFEYDVTPPWSPVDSILGTNRRLRDVLEAKGYDVTYAEFSGGHDYLVWRETIADGLIALLAR